ncbi:MAG: NlpC/P60 family protein [Bacteroidota bacterium]
MTFRHIARQKIFYVLTVLLTLTCAACTNPSTKAPPEEWQPEAVTEPAKPQAEVLTETAEAPSEMDEEKEEVEKLTPKGVGAKISGKNYDPNFLSEDSLVMEQMYADMLEPIASLKSSDPNIYWFIVSWLNTAYKTPDWSGYGEPGWRQQAKRKGVDCSGFTRVMQDKIWNRKISGGSQGLLDHYCNRIDQSSLTMGDLVFFRAPYSENDRIVHVGIYLMDDFFVHATSTKSAEEGRGLMINSLQEENWAKEFVTGGTIKGS